MRPSQGAPREMLLLLLPPLPAGTLKLPKSRTSLELF
jgi:hypothetical protein